MPYQLRLHSRRGTSGITTPSALRMSRRRINEQLEAEAVTLDIPMRHLASLDLDLHPLIISAARKYRILHTPVTQFYDEMMEAYRNLIGQRWGAVRLSLTNPVIWAKDRGEGMCVVFSNLSMSHHQLGSMYQENPWYPTHSNGVASSIKESLECPTRSAAWTPTSRGLRKLNIRRRISLTRTLARHVKLNGMDLDAKTIDNLAAKMMDVYRPTSFEKADSLESMRRMYTKNSSETPGSCMDTTHSYSLENGAPVDWYAHCPNTVGYYITRGGTVLARTIANLNEKNNVWYWTRIYYVKEVYKTQLKDHMNKIGVLFADETKIKEIQNSATNKTFDIPMDYNNGNPSCPMPYFDITPSKYICIKVSDCGDVIKCHMSSGHVSQSERPGLDNWVVPNFCSTNGAHVFGEYDSYTECTACGNELNIDEDDYIRLPSTGTYCCGTECAVDADYYRWQTSNNCEWHHSSSLPNEHSITCHSEPTKFSNLEAAIQSQEGRFYYPIPWADTEEILLMSRWGRMNWDTYTMDETSYLLTNPVTGKLYKPHGIPTVFPHAFRQSIGKYSALNENGRMTLKFTTVPAIHALLDRKEVQRRLDYSQTKFVYVTRENEEVDELVMIQNLFNGALAKFLGTDKPTSCAETVVGVTITQH